MSLYVVTPVEVVAIWVNGPVEVVPRSILNPVSLFELSSQDKEMLSLAADVATRPEGAVGSEMPATMVMAPTGPTYVEMPSEFCAANR